MAGATKGESRRNWADALAIVTGVTLIGISIWPSMPTWSNDRQLARAFFAGAAVAQILAGLMSIGAVVIAQRAERRGLGRGVLIAAAVLLVATLVLFRDFDTYSLATTVLPAILLLVAASSIGPMPD